MFSHAAEKERERERKKIIKKFFTIFPSPPLFSLVFIFVRRARQAKISLLPHKGEGIFSPHFFYNRSIDK
jgi:hypothetical protein